LQLVVHKVNTSDPDNELSFHVQRSVVSVTLSCHCHSRLEDTGTLYIHMIWNKRIHASRTEERANNSTRVTPGVAVVVGNHNKRNRRE
jgi:hypothetical protein